MSQLEDFIKKHRDEFDDLEPSEDHFKTFEEKLKFAQIASTKRVKNRFPFGKVAVVVVFILSSSMLVNELFFNKPQYEAGIGIIKNSYNEVLETRYKQINIAVDKLPESVREDYERQLEELKKQTKQFEKTLDMTSNTPQVRQSMMQYYKKTNKTLIRMMINAERNQSLNPKNQ